MGVSEEGSSASRRERKLASEERADNKIGKWLCVDNGWGIWSGRAEQNDKEEIGDKWIFRHGEEEKETDKI